jgi:hypothetical protein
MVSMIDSMTWLVWRWMYSGSRTSNMWRIAPTNASGFCTCHARAGDVNQMIQYMQQLLN